MDKEILAFISRAAHEIRTPLNSVNAILELLEKEHTLKNRDKLLDAKLSMNYVINLLNTILNYSKIEESNKTPTICPITKEEILPVINALIKPIAAIKNIEFVLTYQEVYRCFYTDQEILLQIIINLLSNAVAYTNFGGKVSLDLRLEYLEEYRERLWLEVSDNGIGMSEEFIKKAFVPYQKEGRKEIENSTGLGLSITRDLVEQIGGEISVKSQPDKGTVFTVVFEVDASNEIFWNQAVKDETEKVAEQKKNIFLKGKKILIAEDDELSIEMEASMINHMGGSADKTYDGEEVVEIFRSSGFMEYFLILIDLSMPLKDGLAAISEIRQMSRPDAKEIPIIAVTGFDVMTDRKQLSELGINALLLKPFSEEQMKEAFFSLLGEDYANEENVE